jgi:hypothetical protein
MNEKNEEACSNILMKAGYSFWRVIGSLNFFHLLQLALRREWLMTSPGGNVAVHDILIKVATRQSTLLPFTFHTLLSSISPYSFLSWGSSGQYLRI